MPSRPVILATSLLSVAAAAAALDLVRAVRRFEPAAVGQDAVSRQLAKFARLRADLPRAAVLRVVGDTRELDPGLSAVADRLTEAIRQQLRTGGFDAMPADVRPFVEHVAAGYLERYPDARGHGLPELRENLLAWWGGLVGGLHLAQMRYVLAPHLVVERGDADFVVGDFSPDFDHRELAAREGLTLVEDYGGGAVLFRPGS